MPINLFKHSPYEISTDLDHQFITAFEREYWNNKSDFDHTHNDLDSKMNDFSKYTNSVSLNKLGAKSTAVKYNSVTKLYEMPDISDIVRDSLKLGCDTIIFPNGDYLIDSEILIDRPVRILGGNTNLYCSPSSRSKRIFKVTSSDVTIDGFNFYSTPEYPSTLIDNDKSTITSNVLAIDIVGSTPEDRNIIINNCHGDNVTYLVSIINMKHVQLNQCTTSEVYFPVYSGSNSEFITIKNCKLHATESTDVYGHVLYLAEGTHRVYVTNCELVSLGSEGSNIIKCGSTGKSSDVIVRDSTIIMNTASTVFYLHNDSDLTLINCTVLANSSKGYSRLLQLNENSKFKCTDCTIYLDSFDRYTQRYDISGSSVLFDNCSITVTNALEKYAVLQFVSGSDELKFTNCIIHINTSRVFNLMPSDFKCLDLVGCTIVSSCKVVCGLYDSYSVNYTKTTNPRLTIINTIIKNESDSSMGVDSLFMNISTSSLRATAILSNITCYKCTGTSGSNSGKLFMSSSESQYIKNNIIDVTP